MTNFEKIKNMSSVEEMARFFVWFYFDVEIHSGKYTNMEKLLNSEAEE